MKRKSRFPLHKKSNSLKLKNTYDLSNWEHFLPRNLREGRSPSLNLSGGANVPRPPLYPPLLQCVPVNMIISRNSWDSHVIILNYLFISNSNITSIILSWNSLGPGISKMWSVIFLMVSKAKEHNGFRSE